MHKILSKLFLTVALIIFAMSNTAQAMPEIFPLDQLKSGMSGKAYTVVDGSGKIESFDVHIVGMTDDGKGSKRMIMAEASVMPTMRTSGILQGMSGSPVYINGKLIGALAATLKEMDPYTVFITPIESMLELWTLPDPKAQVNHFKTVQIEEEESKSDEPETKDESTAESDEAKKVEVADKNEPTVEPVKDTPKVEEVDALYLSGFDANGAKFLLRELGLKNLQSPPTVLERGIQLVG